MSERIVLIFAYHFPPENAIGGRRPFRFCQYLPKMGYRCHVITAADQSSLPGSTAEYVPDPSLDPSVKGIAWQSERVVRKLLLPGVIGMRWSQLACDAARRFVQANPGAEITIFSTAPPLGVHLAAWQFARTSGLPWIADFRDPLKFAPWLGAFTPFQGKVSAGVERLCISSADLVIANTDAMADEWRVEHPDRASRIHLIWNGFDLKERIEPLEVPARDCKLYSHLGELYAGRNITPFLESVARLIDSGRLSAAEIRIRLVGKMDPPSMPSESFLQRAQNQGWLELIPREVPRLEAQHLMQTLDGLLLVQPQSSIQVPGKLFDYVQIGRPILAYVPHDTPIERVLAQSGIPYRCAFATDAQAEFDAAVYGYFSLPRSTTSMSASFLDDFDAERQTRRLAELIQSLYGPGTST